MAKEESVTVKDAIHKLQLCLLEGVQDENQLNIVGSLISQSDYHDIVTERSIANMCGYPLCSNSLPSERPWKGRYRISLKEHKVYDLHETYMYCSTSCVVNSQAFSRSLQEERCSVLNPAKLNEVLRMFEGLSLDAKEDLGKHGDLGLSELKIQEKAAMKTGEVPLEEWMGPSNAIEGYVPQRDRRMKSSSSKNRKEGSKLRHGQPNEEKDIIFNATDFMSTIISQDEYSISKMSSGPVKTSSEESKEPKGKLSFKEMEDQLAILNKPSAPEQINFKSKELNEENSCIVTNNKINISQVTSNGIGINGNEAGQGFHAGKTAEWNSSILKPSLKSSGAKKVTRFVTWADESSNDAGSGNLCEFEEVEEKKENSGGSSIADMEVDDNAFRFASAEACAIALNEAAESVASGGSDVSDAVSEAGIIILPPPYDVNEAESEDNAHMLDSEPAPLKWPRKPGVSHSDLFDSEDSWYDSPPEGFSLTLSPFATMFMALFSWISSSSLAYVYGRDESFHEEYLSINGREYPQRIILADGRSSEIKQTLAGCLARALPGLVADLRLPTPVSSLEQQMVLGPLAGYNVFY
ncbi:unnamed protein product [Ilex paraguariensis]|uniref:RNA polymerase II subunit B1 CTD phosphatase RPAP2 homolog n=1 Tax=Ilex paraguariensis TaxID=185542 RepID=A0ABC8R3D6_9AQUA